MPANATVFFHELMSIFAFEFVEIGPLIDRILDLKPSDPVNGNFAALGFESLYMLDNLGTFVLAFAFLFV